MSKWANEIRPHPGDGTWLAMMPLGSPERTPRATRRRTRKNPVPGCEECADRESGPCGKHQECDPLATIGGES